jgi:TRAP-type C4-dicarboxylate transport system permease small subunit
MTRGAETREEREAAPAEGWQPGGWLRDAEEIVACAALVIVVLATSWGVFTRYVSSQPATWSAEIAAAGFCWMIFFGAAAVTKRGPHVSIDILVMTFSPPIRAILARTIDVGLVAFLAWLTVLAGQFTIDSWDTPMPSLRWPYALHYAGAALGLAAMTLRQAQTAWRGPKATA